MSASRTLAGIGTSFRICPETEIWNWWRDSLLLKNHQQMNEHIIRTYTNMSLSFNNFRSKILSPIKKNSSEVSNTFLLPLRVHLQMTELHHKLGFKKFVITSEVIIEVPARAGEVWWS